MEKAEGAFLTIGELARELGVAQHILRYWETRFPQLRPLQRSGNRRYYRPRDVEIARRIHQLLNVQGFTVKGAVKALSERATVASAPAAPQPAAEPAAPQQACDTGQLIDRLRNIRAELAQAVNQAG
jgi:DNA-binding transcriptional MerR regulator